MFAAAALTLGAASCGDQSFSRQAAVDSFQRANPEATGEQAGCVVDGLVERYSIDELGRELEADPLDAAFEEAQFRQMFVCDVAGEWRQDITDQLVANGVAPGDAPCVSDELFATMSDDDVDVLLSGEITEEFSATFLAALDACDALNP